MVGRGPESNKGILFEGEKFLSILKCKNGYDKGLYIASPSRVRITRAEGNSPGQDRYS